jgi:hypothetical protein
MICGFVQSWRLQRVAVGAFNQTHCGHGMTCSSATICKHPSQSFAPSNLSQHRMLHSSPNAGALPQHEVLEMPALSPTMKTGILEVWHIKEGEAISAGDCMATIVTDKSSMSTFIVRSVFFCYILRRWRACTHFPHISFLIWFATAKAQLGPALPLVCADYPKLITLSLFG